MTELLQIYKCEVCGNIVEVLHTGTGTLVCCGQPMKLMEEQTADFTKEKHVPIVEETKDGIHVVVGSTPHPMVDAHWIEWIQVVKDGTIMRQFLEPGQKPEADFPMKDKPDMAREYCNIHLLWKTS
ncbi:MAG: desulfoferrodoxin [Promethearchaeota archaeon]